MPTKQGHLVETNARKWKAPSAGSANIAQSSAAEGKVTL